MKWIQQIITKINNMAAFDRSVSQRLNIHNKNIQTLQKELNDTRKKLYLLENKLIRKGVIECPRQEDTQRRN